MPRRISTLSSPSRPCSEPPTATAHECNSWHRCRTIYSNTPSRPDIPPSPMARADAKLRDGWGELVNIVGGHMQALILPVLSLGALAGGPAASPGLQQAPDLAGQGLLGKRLGQERRTRFEQASLEYL